LLSLVPGEGLYMVSGTSVSSLSVSLLLDFLLTFDS